MAKKNFKFRLEKLLSYRVMREKLERQKLMAAEARLQDELNKKAMLDQQERNAIERITPKRGEYINPERIIQTEGWLVEHRKRQTMQQWDVDEAREAVNAQTLVHRKAQQDIKVLEKLKEKQLEEFRLEQLREEQIFLDDLASQQFIRQTVEAERRAIIDTEKELVEAAEAEGFLLKAEEAI